MFYYDNEPIIHNAEDFEALEPDLLMFSINNIITKPLVKPYWGFENHNGLSGFTMSTNGITEDYYLDTIVNAYRGPNEMYRFTNKNKSMYVYLVI